MAVKKADEYQHNNGDFAFVDSNFLRGGGRIVADLTALYALAANVDQLKQNVTIVHVSDIGSGVQSKYELINITDISSGVFNSTAWKQIQGVGTSDSPSFTGITITGSNPIAYLTDVTTEVTNRNIAIAAAVAAGNHYRGKYATLSALTTAIPSGSDGDYAIVIGSISDQEYIWDSDHTAWVLSTVIPAGTFASLGGSPSDNTALAAALAAKVDIVSGYGLISSSDQTKLTGIAAGATANSAAAQSDVTTGTDNVKYLTSSLWTWIKTQVQTISGIWNFSNGLQSGGNNVLTANQSISFAPTGDVTGTASGATSLAPALTISAGAITTSKIAAGAVDLGAKVTGTLPVGNGGTGSATQNFVDLTTNQTLGGNKNLTGMLGLNIVSPIAQIQMNSIALGISGFSRGYYHSGINRAIADNDVLTKMDLTGGTYDFNTGATALIASSTLTITTAGTGYTNGTYAAVALTGGAGTGATATVVIIGGVINTVTVASRGTGYVIGNTLSFANTSVGGTGSGFTSVLIANNLGFANTTRVSLKIGAVGETAGMLPYADNAVNLGSTALRFNTIVATSLQSSGINTNNANFVLTNPASGIQVLFISNGNQILNHGNTAVDAGYRLDVFTNISDSPNGAIRTSGPIAATSGEARAVYINNTLNPIASNDSLVGLHVAPAFGTNTSAIKTLGAITGGSGYTNITAQLRTLTGGSGSGATANITVVSGVVTAVTLISQGAGYTTSDVLSCTTIGAGTGFSIPVTAIGLTGLKNIAIQSDGDFLLNGKFNIATSGGSASAGKATLVAGTITVNTSSVTANSKVFVSINTPGGTVGYPYAKDADIVAGTSFIINSTSGADTSVINWWIIN